MTEKVFEQMERKEMTGFVAFVKGVVGIRGSVMLSGKFSSQVINKYVPNCDYWMVQTMWCYLVKSLRYELDISQAISIAVVVIDLIKIIIPSLDFPACIGGDIVQQIVPC